MIYFKLLKLKFSIKSHKVWEEWKQENSSNINEVIRSVLNFFLQKDFTGTKPLTANKNKCAQNTSK